jgi:hypothetical protein
VGGLMGGEGRLVLGFSMTWHGSCTSVFLMAVIEPLEYLVLGEGKLTFLFFFLTMTMAAMMAATIPAATNARAMNRNINPPTNPPSIQ